MRVGFFILKSARQIRLFFRWSHEFKNVSRHEKCCKKDGDEQKKACDEKHKDGRENKQGGDEKSGDEKHAERSEKSRQTIG